MAGIARETGFTGVQLHAAHGYLISAFLSPRLNRRTDGWGGSLAARARFLLDAVARTRRAVGSDFPLAVKLNSADFQKGGFTFDDSIQVAKWLEDAGVDLIEISGGNYEQPSMFDMQGRPDDAEPPQRQSTRRREAFFPGLCGTLAHRGETAPGGDRGFRSRDVMIEALNRQALDVIGLARPLVTEPDLSRRIMDGTSDGAIVYERDLRVGKGRFGPNSNIFLFKALNALGPLAWYYRQIILLSENRDPQVHMGVLKALMRHQAPRSDCRGHAAKQCDGRLTTETTCNAFGSAGS